MIARGSTLTSLVIAAAALLAPGAAQAGIVVMDTGEVIVGKIDPARGVTAEGIRVTWPYKEERTEGELVAERHLVRWFDAEADLLTDAYFEQHLEAPLRGSRWLRMREEYRLRVQRRTEPDPGIPSPIPHLTLSDTDLEVLPIPGEGFTIRKPTGWEARTEAGILILQAPPQPGRRFRPRVHVFSVRAAAASYDDQLAWVQRELQDLARVGEFEVTERSRLRKREGGADQRLRTTTTVSDRTVAALREVRFREDRTFFFAAYVEAKDVPALDELLRRCLASWELDADAAAPR